MRASNVSSGSLVSSTMKKCFRRQVEVHPIILRTHSCHPRRKFYSKYLKSRFLLSV
jgi:hypothetical protein